MKSIKPGRGPSMMSGVVGILIALFGVFWTVIAATIGGGLLVPFGVIFTLTALVGSIYNFKNAVSKNRNSVIDITDSIEEHDPLNERFGNDNTARSTSENYSRVGRYCPYCGATVKEDYKFCNGCGARLPNR